MNDILEYRKASAEWMGKKPQFIRGFGKIHMITEYWQPDQDANQREMIEDWLIEQGYFITMHRSQAIKKIWAVAIGKDETLNLFYRGEDKSKSVAFMNAFMEWNHAKQLENLA